MTRATSKGINRIDQNGETIYKMSSARDHVDLVNGVEVIVTDNPAFYLSQFKYNFAIPSIQRSNAGTLNTILEELSDTKSKSAIAFINSISTNGILNSLTDINNATLLIRNTDANNIANGKLSEEAFTQMNPNLRKIVRKIIRDGRKMYTSFDESLNIIAGRIPAQSQQSFMAQRLVAFENPNVNSAYVSTW